MDLFRDGFKAPKFIELDNDKVRASLSLSEAGASCFFPTVYYTCPVQVSMIS